MTMLPPPLCGFVAGMPFPSLVVIDHAVSGLVPDLYAELVCATAAVDLPIDSGQHEAVVACAVDRASALVQGPRAGHH